MSNKRIVSPAEVMGVKKKSLADKCGIKAGDRILSINGKILRDILDYELSVADESIKIEIDRGGDRKVVMIDNPDFDNLGIRFSTSLFDGIKRCANKCVFCFIDQLPPGMRDSVYVKDDDYRLSLLYGNFITLTNMNDADIKRIIEERISPLYVSLHTTNPFLRAMMLGRKKPDKTLKYLKALSDAGIEIHIQVVLCPGINDGAGLEKTIKDLAEGYDGVSSVGIVPVGLTGHREGLYPLRSFGKKEIIKLINRAGMWHKRFEKEKGAAWVYLADEFYIAGGRRLPPAEHYGDFPQVENGIGLSRLFIDEAAEGIKNKGKRKAPGKRKIALVTGKLFAGILKDVAKSASKITGLSIEVINVKSKFFGGKVNVTGLLTGSDIISGIKKWLKSNEKPDVIVLPDVILNADGLTLDDHSPKMIEDKLGIKIKVTGSTGNGFVEAMKSFMDHEIMNKKTGGFSKK